VTVVEWPDGIARNFLAEMSLDGARFSAPTALVSSKVEVWVQASEGAPLRLMGKPSRLRSQGASTELYVQFDEMDLFTELALARMLDEVWE
jgi:hypothetical protein